MILKQTQERNKEDCLKQIETLKERGKNILNYEIIEKTTFQGLPLLLKVYYKD